MNGSKTLIEILRWRARHQNDRRAFTFLRHGEIEHGSLSYADLDQQARAIAAQLAALGVVPGERALLLFPTGLAYIAAFFGCLYAGVIAVPAYPPQRRRNLARIKGIVADARPTIVLTEELLLGSLQEQVETLACPPMQWLATDSIAPTSCEVPPPAPIDLNTPAFLQYTSGSTAEPRGVVVTHGNLAHNEAMIKQAMGHDAQSVFVSWLPLFHDMGLIGNMLQPIYIGAPCFLMAPGDFLQKPIRWLQAIARYRAHTSGAPNFAYDLCIEKITTEQCTGLDLRTWRVAYNGSEPVRSRTLERFSDTFAACGFRPEAFYPCYGLAETTLFVSGGDQHRQADTCTLQAGALEHDRITPESTPTANTRTLVSCGRSWLQQRIIIVDPNTSTPSPADRVGEIWVAGPNVAAGYWNRPEETRKTFGATLTDSDDGPFFRTGDLGFIRDGELFVTGRLKDLLIIRGRNHYPQDIERTVELSHRALQQGCGAAFSVEMGNQEHLVVVFEVQRSMMRRLNVDEVVAAIRSVVSECHDLQVYAVTLLKPGGIPKTSSGKIQRHLCRSGFIENTLAAVGQWAQPLMDSDAQRESSRECPLPSPELALTASAVEAWLIARITEGLQVDPRTLDTNASFAQIGLDSSMIMSLTGELAEWLGRELEPTVLWEYPTIAGLAEHLAEAS